MTHWIKRSLSAGLIFLTTLALVGCDERAPWPPQLGKPFPAIEFTNYDGRKIRMSDFKGKVVLVEPVGMNCPACNAWSGGNDLGGIADIRPQQGLKSLEEYLSQYGGGVTLERDDFVLVHVILYDLKMGPVEIGEVRAWAEHFGLARRPNVFVVFSERDLRGRASYNMVPGFQLLDKDTVMRFDSTGHRPRHNLYSQLLPEVPRMLNR